MIIILSNNFIWIQFNSEKCLAKPLQQMKHAPVKRLLHVTDKLITLSGIQYCTAHHGGNQTHKFSGDLHRYHK